jgi:hypothetical protein
MTISDDDYERGHTAGITDGRLDGHDNHFAAINGQLADVAKQLARLTLAVQRLGDQATSRDATVIVTAAALKDADEARRQLATTSWAPWAKVATAVGTLVAAAGLLVAFFR